MRLAKGVFAYPLPIRSDVIRSVCIDAPQTVFGPLAVLYYVVRV